MSNQQISPMGMAPAVMGSVMVHATLRRDAAGLVAAAERAETGDLKSRASLFARVLSVHHQGEDDVLLPALVARQPGFAPCSALIQAQHEALDTAVEELELSVGRGDPDTSAIRAVTARELLEEHLSTEEQQCV